MKRKSGFLLPGLAYKSELGFGVSIPYYFALSPTYDLTLTGTGYTQQGFLGEAEWRQRFDNGQYTLKMAGIYQANPDDFDANTIDSGRPDDPNRLRGMVGRPVGAFQNVNNVDDRHRDDRTAIRRSLTTRPPGVDDRPRRYPFGAECSKETGEGRSP